MKPSTLDTKGLYRIAKRLTMMSTLLKELVPQVIDEMVKLEKNHKNIVAAHRAHRTMARRKSK